MKHISLDYHFVREQIAAGSLRVAHVHTKDQFADIFTKTLPRQSVLYFRVKLGGSGGAFILRGRKVYQAV